MANSNPTEQRPSQKPIPLVWRIEPLPDFLADHTLMGEEPSHRIRDVMSRWVQFVSGMWGWHDRATFALRYLAANGRIDVYFCARRTAKVKRASWNKNAAFSCERTG